MDLVYIDVFAKMDVTLMKFLNQTRNYGHAMFPNGYKDIYGSTIKVLMHKK